MPLGALKGDERELKAGTDDRAEEKGGDHPRGRTRARLELVDVDCGPSNCPVEERLELSMEFTLDRPLQHALWEIKFIVDSVHQRHVVELGATKAKDYAQGLSSMHFEVPRVSVEGIKPCTLANTGLLVATLRCSGLGEGRDMGPDGEGEDEVASVNLVVQVADEGRGRLTRCIYSPLE